jgi:hypothetical protein
MLALHKSSHFRWKYLPRKSERKLDEIQHWKQNNCSRSQRFSSNIKLRFNLPLFVFSINSMLQLTTDSLFPTTATLFATWTTVDWFLNQLLFFVLLSSRCLQQPTLESDKLIRLVIDDWAHSFLESKQIQSKAADSMPSTLSKTSLFLRTTPLSSRWTNLGIWSSSQLQPYSLSIHWCWIDKCCHRSASKSIVRFLLIV